jgi:hypothetical protein
VIIGAGAFTIAKGFIEKKSAKSEDDRHKDIEKELKRTITGMSNQFLEKHSQRLMELVA